MKDLYLFDVCRVVGGGGGGIKKTRLTTKGGKVFLLFHSVFLEYSSSSRHTNIILELKLLGYGIYMGFTSNRRFKALYKFNLLNLS